VFIVVFYFNTVFFLLHSLAVVVLMSASD